MNKRLLLSLSFFLLNQFVIGQGAYITSVLINSCNGTCSEGDNEIIFGNTGDGSLLATPANLNITYGSSPAPTATYTDAFVNNPTTTTNLNVTAGCSLFIDAAGTTIPAGAAFIVVRSTICTSALNWSALCGNAPIYIIYSTDATWNTAGNFSNGTSTTRYFKSEITTSSGTNTLNYDYTLPSAFGNDGAYANWASTGGSAILYGDNDCAITPTALPLTILDFFVENDNCKNTFSWTVEDDQMIDYYQIQYSLDGFNFNSLAEIPAKQSLYQTYYSFSSDKNFSDTWYVRLTAIDFNNRMECHPKTLIMKPTATLGFHYEAGVFYNFRDKTCQLTSINGNRQITVDPKSIVHLERGIWLVSYSEEIYKCLAY